MIMRDWTHPNTLWEYSALGAAIVEHVEGPDLAMPKAISGISELYGYKGVWTRLVEMWAGR